MTVLTKGVIISSATAASAVGIYLGIKYFDNKSIKDHLLKSGYKLISSLSKVEEVPQWDAEFTSDKANIRKLLNISENEDSSGGSRLQEWCNSKMNSKYSEDDEDLKNIKNYCVIRTVKDQLSRNNKTVLTEWSGDEKWKSTYNKRKEGNIATVRNQIEELSGDLEESKEGTDLPIIKKWCKQNLKRNFIVKKLRDRYEIIERWCTVEGASTTS